MVVFTLHFVKMHAFVRYFFDVVDFPPGGCKGAFSTCVFQLALCSMLCYFFDVAQVFVAVLAVVLFVTIAVVYLLLFMSLWS